MQAKFDGRFSSLSFEMAGAQCGHGRGLRNAMGDSVVNSAVNNYNQRSSLPVHSCIFMALCIDPFACNVRIVFG
jgi:hypothetical protein